MQEKKKRSIVPYWVSQSYVQGSPGRSIVSSKTDNLSMTAKQFDRFIHQGVSARSDIEWWHQYCSVWNGTAMMFRAGKEKVEFDISIVSDASGSWGCGAINGPNWFQILWAGLGSSSE